MTKDGEIPAIFNPKRVRTPSVVVTGDSPNGPYGGFTNIIDGSNSAQLTKQDSLTSSHGGNESDNTCINQPLQMTPSIGGGISGLIADQTQIMRSTPTAHSDNDDVESPGTEIPQSPNVHIRRLKACKESCCSELAQKMYFGVCVTILVTASWVGATHCIKFLYLNVFRTIETLPNDAEKTSSVIPSDNDDHLGSGEDNSTTGFLLPHHLGELKTTTTIFNAPFFAAWFCTNFCFFFFPIYLLGRISVRKCDKPGEILGDVLRGFRDRGFTVGRFLNRCITFCILWVLTTYLYAMSLRSLLATDVLALFATNVASVYLLSWVILHEQFVGVRIVAVILCDTGIALLAYMDGITGSPTLAGVVLSALAAAGYAVFKVMFRKVMGDPPIGQIAFTFTILGFLNATLLWPICVGLYLTGTEVMPFDRLPWIILLIASVLLLVFHILTQFSAAVTYNMFVTLGLITAVPVSGALDVILYSATFAGMKLAGIILIAVGFFLVMFPENWPDYITRLLRKTGHAILRCQCCCEYAEIEIDNSKYHLVGSQREMGERSPQRFFNRSSSHSYRLSHGLHTVPSSVAIGESKMTDFRMTDLSLSLYPQQAAAIPFLGPNRSPQSLLYHQQQLQQQPMYQYQQQHQQQQQQTGNNSNHSGARFLSYFGNEDKERKKSETSFFNLGFRRKSTIFFAATD